VVGVVHILKTRFHSENMGGQCQKHHIVGYVVAVLKKFSHLRERVSPEMQDPTDDAMRLSCWLEVICSMTSGARFLCMGWDKQQPQ
jgi:hypothetical protein